MVGADEDSLEPVDLDGDVADVVAERVEHATIDDACAFAWEVLCRRSDIDLDRSQVYWWTYKVALRQAWTLGRRRHREQPMGGLNGADEDSLEPMDLDSDVADVVAERIEHASMREVLGRLHWRERRELALFAYGLSYEEIATVTGASYTAVNRWMARGRKVLNPRAPMPSMSVSQFLR